MLSVGAFAQTQKAFLKAADEAYSGKNYYSALVYYQEALAFDDDNLDIRYKLAESARKFSSYDLAEQNYQYIKDNDAENKFPLSTFFLAETMQMQGKYEKAQEMYNLYISENSGDDEYYSFKADKERAASEWALKEIAEPDETITVKNAGDKINTGYSEIASSINGKDFYFSAMRFDEKGSDEKVAKVLKTDLPKDFESTFGTTSLLEGDFNSENGIVANTAFNKDKSKIFYTVCERLNGEDIRCDLYCKMIGSDGKFGESKKLPDFVNAAGYTSTQPTIGYDKTTDKEILYFSSDREGGKGKLDIWYSIIDNKDNFTKPANLTSINTKEDELTPFFHIPSSTLYFSSDGYRSFGGYDVYSTSYNGKTYGEPAHLNNPLNSSYHDIYFILSDDEETGYFSTNREGAQFIDNVQKACCFDIYRVKFDELELNLNALTYDKISLADLPGATVKLYNEDTGELIGEITNNDGIDHKFKLERCTNYIIIAEKSGYKSDTIKYSTCGLKKSQEIIKKLYLEPDFLELDVFTFDDATKEALSGATIVLTDLTDSSIEPIIITNAQANDFNFKLIRGNKYKVDASRPGYYPASIDVITENIAGTKITKNIYLRKDPVGTLYSMLPVKLYFDNDHPNPNSIARSTNKTYTDTYNRYLTRKSNFVSRSSNPVEIDNFFDIDIVGGYEQYLKFLNGLQAVLARGTSIEIIVKGHASPLSQTEYNLYLGQRRVSSILNEMKQFNGGILIPYITSGQLKITDISYGESLTEPDVSDSKKDPKASIYSVQASKERRVEIIDVTRQQN